jgi:hypothetical protein
MAEQRFPIRIGARSAGLLRVLFGVTAETAWAAVDDEVVSARFGRFSFATPLTTSSATGSRSLALDHGHRRSPQRPPCRRVVRRQAHGGVRLDFREPIRWTVFRTPAFVAPEDLEAFAAAVARGVLGGTRAAPSSSGPPCVADVPDLLLAGSPSRGTSASRPKGQVHRHVAAVVVDRAGPRQRHPVDELAGLEREVRALVRRRVVEGVPKSQPIAIGSSSSSSA